MDYCCTEDHPHSWAVEEQKLVVLKPLPPIRHIVSKGDSNWAKLIRCHSSLSSFFNPFFKKRESIRKDITLREPSAKRTYCKSYRTPTLILTT